MEQTVDGAVKKLGINLIVLYGQGCGTPKTVTIVASKSNDHRLS